MLTRGLCGDSHQFLIQVTVHTQEAMCRLVLSAYLTGVFGKEGFEESRQHVWSISEIAYRVVLGAAPVMRSGLTYTTKDGQWQANPFRSPNLPAS